MPTNLKSYLATQIVSIATPTASAAMFQPASGSPGAAPIIGGAVGGFVALILVSFLFLLWRRDKKQRRRREGDGDHVERARASKSKMSIDDDNDSGNGREVLREKYGWEQDGIDSKGTGRDQQESDQEQAHRHHREREELRIRNAAGSSNYSRSTSLRQSQQISRQTMIHQPPLRFTRPPVGRDIPRQSSRVSNSSFATSSLPSPISDRAYSYPSGQSYPSTQHHYSTDRASSENYNPSPFNRNRQSETLIAAPQPTHTLSPRSSYIPEIQEIRNVERAGQTRVDAQSEVSNYRPQQSYLSSSPDLSIWVSDESDQEKCKRLARDGRQNASTGSGSYPFHTQGFGEERRAFPVPEV